MRSPNSTIKEINQNLKSPRTRNNSRLDMSTGSKSGTIKIFRPGYQSKNMISKEYDDIDPIYYERDPILSSIQQR